MEEKEKLEMKLETKIDVTKIKQVILEIELNKIYESDEKRVLSILNDLNEVCKNHKEHISYGFKLILE